MTRTLSRELILRQRQKIVDWARTAFRCPFDQGVRDGRLRSDCLDRGAGCVNAHVRICGNRGGVITRGHPAPSRHSGGMPESRTMDGKPQYRLIVCPPGTGSRPPAGTTTERDDDD